MRSQRTRNLLFDLAKGFALLAALLGILAGTCGFMWADWVPRSTMERLPGASKAEVRELLGEPDSIDNEFNRWSYHRPLRVAEFRVNFDTADRGEYWSYDR